MIDGMMALKSKHTLEFLPHSLENFIFDSRRVLNVKLEPNKHVDQLKA